MKKSVTTKRGKGHPSTYSAKIANEICEWIVEAKSLAAFCRVRKIGYTTVMQWLDAHEDFAKNYARARENSGHTEADMVGDIKERMLRGEITPEMARVAIDACKWSAGKRLPKRYGERLDQFVEFEAGPKLLESTRERAMAIVSMLDRNRPSSEQIIEMEHSDS
ncbi:MAG: hypothetical protein ACEQSB_05675 [Undibacterium sp.]